MTAVQLKIFAKAVKLRLAAGEDIDEILASYPKLTDAEKKTLKDAVNPKQ